MEITSDVPAAVVARARSSGLSAEAFVEQLLGRLAAADAGQDRNRERLRNELAADWGHYSTTGLHLDGEEVDAWLRQLEEGRDAEPPALHA
ncbi:MAG: hypothetical protein ACRD19_04820 [Terriglobia bacterium]